MGDLAERDERINALDGVRGLAALWVFATHATYSGLLPPLINFRGAGRGGVVLFFFLSAFLISGPFFQDTKRALTWRSWSAYCIKRVVRIVPLYTLVLVSLFLLKRVPFNGSPSPSPSLLIEHLTFQQGQSVFWSTVVEMRFYLVLPFLLVASAWACGKFRHGPAFVLLAGGVWIATASIAALTGRNTALLGIDKHAVVFVCGIMTSLIVYSGRFPIPTQRTVRVCLECAAWLLAVAILVLSIPALYHGVVDGISIADYAATSPIYEAFWDARIGWIGILFALFFLSFLNGTGLMSRLLASRPLMLVGKVSFGFYLIQLQWIIWANKQLSLPTPLLLLCALAAAFTSSYVLFTLIENPLIGMGRKLARAAVTGSRARRGEYRDASERALR